MLSQLFTKFKKETVSAEIVTLLNVIEKKNGTILFAAEQGSRSWGFADANSDYDVKFIYIDPLEIKLSLKDYKDAYEYKFVTKPEGKLGEQKPVEVSGWELRKALNLLKSSNVSLLEQLFSPIVYSSDPEFLQQVQKFALDFFNPLAAIHSYVGIASNTLSEHIIKDGSNVKKLKKYFYCIRPLLAALYVKYQLQPVLPPVDFSQLLEQVHKAKLIDNQIHGVIKEIYHTKLEGGNDLHIKTDQAILDWIQMQISSLRTYPTPTNITGVPKSLSPKTPKNIEALDQFYFEQVVKRVRIS